MKRTTPDRRTERTVGVIHLGCPKNQVDSEEMMAVLAEDGWALTGDPEDADVLVVNTCAFIEAAREEAYATIRRALARKRRRCRKVVVAGCLAQRYAQQLAEQFPGVDAIVGVGETQRLPDILRRAMRGDRPVVVRQQPRQWNEVGVRLLSTPPWTAYVRIGEGCDHRCAFCAIPDIRGAWRSRPAEYILEEVRALVDGGLKEAVLVGQDTTLYGRDIRNGGGAGDWNLARLVREIGKIGGLRWQRIMYAHPARIGPETIELFGEVPNLAAYIDLPFQAGDDMLLKKMQRAGTAARYLELIRSLRERLPRIAVRSTFLVGFPGETDESFQRTCEFVRQAELDRAGVFVYSDEEGTPAYRGQPAVPGDVAQARAQELMQVQAEVSRRRLAALVGTRIEVLVEDREAPGRFSGRSERDAPEVDGRVVLHGAGLHPGTIVPAVVTASGVHDLEARVIDGPEESPADATQVI